MLKRWMPQRVDDKRKEIVIREIREGSSPESRFYFMVVISTLIAVFFTFSLVELVQERYLTRTIHQVLAGKFSKIPGVDIEKILIKHDPELLNVLATVQTSSALNPEKVRSYVPYTRRWRKDARAFSLHDREGPHRMGGGPPTLLGVPSESVMTDYHRSNDYFLPTSVIDEKTRI